MKNAPTIVISILVILFAVILINGCTLGTPNNPSQLSTVVKSQTNLPSVRSSEDLKPTLHISPSWTPVSNTPITRFTPTITPVPTETNTLMPTFNPTERENAVKDLLNNDVSCKLPCFWGFIPGNSNWNDVMSTITERGFKWSKPYNAIVGDGQLYDTSMGSAFSQFTLSISSVVVNDTLDAMLIGISGPEISTAIPGYYLPNLINRLGEPSRIWVASSYREGIPIPIFEFWIFYDSQGVALKYNSSALLEGDKLKVCPKDPNRFVNGNPKLYGENIYLQSPSNTRKLEDLIRVRGEKVPDLPYSVEETTGHSIEETAGISPKVFYTMISAEKPQDCFSTPKSLWLNK